MGDFCHMNFTSIFVKKAEGKKKDKTAEEEDQKQAKQAVLDRTEAVGTAEISPGEAKVPADVQREVEKTA